MCIFVKMTHYVKTYFSVEFFLFLKLSGKCNGLITSLGKERAGLYASHAIVCLFCMRTLFLFPLPL